MNDICRCTDDKCPSRETCRRWLIPPRDYQTHFWASPRLHWETKCEYYLKAKKGNKP